MQIEVEVKCMQTKFNRCGVSGFRDIAPFCLQNGQKIESAQKIHASRGVCEMHANQF